MNMLLSFLCTIFLFNFFASDMAHASTGKMVGSVHHMSDRDVDQKFSPFLGLEMSEKCPWVEGLEAVALLGVGSVDQPEGADQKSEYARLALDLYYPMGGWKLGLGGAMESDKDTFQAFNDYAHVTAEYKLW